MKKKKVLKKKTAKKPAKGKKGTAIFINRTEPAVKHTINTSKISTEEMQKMQAYGVLPFELRKELYRRLGKK